ncbi:UNVERIFIED_CONTAM: hypothetical protein Sradi_2558300 [Sesamum radiatum]|uniref:DUF4218 domain-containing protein n=1 Tax=Sesamum radiatum TaxID=300843 RepID=A0AAW2SLL1_SESRA
MILRRTVSTIYGRKACYFNCHKQFLPAHHLYRRNKKARSRLTGDQICGVENKIRRARSQICGIENKIARSRLTGDQILDRVANISPTVEMLLLLPDGYGSDHKWIKKNIFWDLPHWSTLLIQHNLNVMHIEKNVFDNIFNTVMDIKRKMKDNMNAHRDLKIICNRPELDERRPNIMPKAVYTLGKEQKRRVYEWIRGLKFSNGYASNFACCVDMTELRMHGMKSHDCHVFMQKLILIAFHEMLPEYVWSVLTKVSLLFQSICSTTLDVNKLHELENSIAIIMCNLEKISSPAFFDSTEHLIVHLPYEARVGEPVQ